jgi:hypothetical protein
VEPEGAEPKTKLVKKAGGGGDTGGGKEEVVPPATKNWVHPECLALLNLIFFILANFCFQNQ